MSSSQRVDILIQIATGTSPMAKTTGRAIVDHSAERSLIRIENVSDYEILRGTEIRVWPAAGAGLKDIEIFLFGVAWATLCHQRGLLPLHASAVLTKGGITAFAGHSGAGKSTTAALMASLGYELVTDDILPISFNRDSLPGAWPYLRRLKLQGSPIIQLGLTSTELVSESLDNQKYFVRPKYAAHDKWNNLAKLYLLEIDPTIFRISIDRITGADAVRALVDHTYHFNFILGSRGFRDHLAYCAQIASKIAVYRLRRPPSFGLRKELGSFICSHLEDPST